MDGFLPASCVARRLSDIYSLISSPATFLSLCESLLARESEEVRRREMSVWLWTHERESQANRAEATNNHTPPEHVLHRIYSMRKCIFNNLLDRIIGTM